MLRKLMQLKRNLYATPKKGSQKATFLFGFLQRIIITIMLDPETFEEKIQDLIVDICKTLYHHGYREVPLGAVMRLIGIEESVAAEHDCDYFRLDGEFEEMIQEDEEIEKEIYEEMSNLVPPPGTVFH